MRDREIYMDTAGLWRSDCIVRKRLTRYYSLESKRERERKNEIIRERVSKRTRQTD